MDEHEHEGFATVSRRMGRGHIFRPTAPEHRVAGTVERVVRDSGNQELTIRFTTAAAEWKEFRESGPNRMTLEAETEMGRIHWRADDLYSLSRWTPYQDHVTVELHLERLDEHERWEVAGTPHAHFSARFTRCTILPAPPDFDCRPDRPLRPDSETTDLLGDNSIVVKTSYSMPIRVNRIPGLLTRDDGIAVWTPTNLADASRREAFEAFAERMDTLATALTFLSAQHVRVTSIERIVASNSSIDITRRLHHAVPPPKLTGSDPVIGPWELHEYLPDIYQALAGSSDGAQPLRHAIRQFAALATAPHAHEQLRYGVVAMDILARAFGSWEECEPVTATRYRHAMIDALAKAGAPAELREHTREMLRAGFSRSFRKGIETMLERLGVDHSDLFPSGFLTLVKARNDLQHQGFVAMETALPDEWTQFPSKLGILIARIILRACGLPRTRSGVWRSGGCFTRPAG